MKHRFLFIALFALMLALVAEQGWAVAPSTQARSVFVSSTGYTTATLNWQRGNGARRIAVVTDVSLAALTSNLPQNATAYTASSVWGAASTTITGSGQVMYDGTGPSVSLTNLNSSSTYYVMVYEYNGAGTASATYNTNTATNNPRYFVTLVPPLPAPTALNATAWTTRLSCSWANASNAEGYDMTLYNNFASSDVYTDIDIGKPSDASIVIGGLTAGTNSYKFKLRSYDNHQNRGSYSGWSSNFTTPARPSISGVVYSPTSSTVAIGGTVAATVTANEPDLVDNASTMNTVGSLSFEQGDPAISPYTYSFVYTVASGNTDRAADAMPVSFVLREEGTNSSVAYTTTGTVAAIDANRPTCTSITRMTANCTKATQVAFQADFSENVTGLGTGDFTVTSTDGGSIADVSGISGSSYSVTVITGTTGSSSISFVPRASTVADHINNYATASHVGDESYDIDKTGGSIALSSPANNSYFTTTQALVANLTGNTGCSSGGSAVTYYTVNPGTDGVYTWSASYTDAPGNAASLSNGPTFSYTVDNTPPGTLSITIPASNPAYAKTYATIDVSTTDATSGINTVGVLITNSSSQTWSGSAWTGDNTSWQTASFVSGTTWSYAIPVGITGTDGTYTVIAKSTDMAGNYSITGTSNTFVVDNVVPNALSITVPASNPAYAYTFASVDVSTTDASAGVNAVAVLVTNTSSQTWGGSAWDGTNASWLTASYISGTTWRYSIAAGITATDGTYTVIAKSTDRAGNYTITGTSNTFIVDKVLPTCTNIVRISSNCTNAASVAFRAYMNEQLPVSEQPTLQLPRQMVDQFRI